MPKQFAPIVPRLPRILHGGDYNPEQWPSHVWLEAIATRLQLRRALRADLPAGVTAQLREDVGQFVFILNCTPDRQEVIRGEAGVTELGGAPVAPTITLDSYETVVLRRIKEENASLPKAPANAMSPL